MTVERHALIPVVGDQRPHLICNRCGWRRDGQWGFEASKKIVAEHDCSATALRAENEVLRHLLALAWEYAYDSDYQWAAPAEVVAEIATKLGLVYDSADGIWREPEDV